MGTLVICLIPRYEMAVVQLLFVCMGNICRSPAAEAVMRHEVEKAGLEALINVDSAGTIGFHAGESPDRRMQQAARKRGYVLESRARQVERMDLERFDWVIVMDEDNYQQVRGLVPGENLPARLHRFCEFCQTRSESSVPDPYYGSEDGFNLVLDILEDGCQGLLAAIKREHRIE